MRHLFICTDCGEYFEKKDASTLCPACLKKPAGKEVKVKKAKTKKK
jgi:rubrerythrin